MHSNRCGWGEVSPIEYPNIFDIDHYRNTKYCDFIKYIKIVYEREGSSHAPPS